MTLTSTPRLLSTLMAALLLCGLGLATASAQTDPVQDTYQQDVANCHQKAGTVDLQACLREAGAAAQASRNNTLSDPAAPARERNLTSRCDAYSGTEREDCLRMMRNGEVDSEGSVLSGGVLRRMTVPVPASGS